MNKFEISITKKETIKMNIFDLNKMKKNPHIIIIGPRGRGKSYLSTVILNHYNDIPHKIIISESDKYNPFYKKSFPEAHITHEYETKTIEELLNRQETIIEKQQEKEKVITKLGQIIPECLMSMDDCLVEKTKIDTRSLILMDDCLVYKKIWAKDNSIKEMLFNGRHYQITSLLTMKYPLGLNPDLRLNFDYIFLLRDNNIANRKRIYEHYAGCFNTFDEFNQVYTKATENHGCLVIDNRLPNDNLFDNVFYYKASMLESKVKESKDSYTDLYLEEGICCDNVKKSLV